MLEGKRIWIIGGAIVIVGAVLLFVTYLTSLVIGFDVSGAHNHINVALGIVGMATLAAGLAFFVMGARRRMKEDPEGKMTFLSMATFFVLSLILLFTVFNPFLSPYDSIRDSDLDGYTDDIDDYPHDKSRYHAPFFDLIVEWKNTTTNFSVTITDVWPYSEDPGPLSRIVLSVKWYSESYFAYMEDVASLEELNGAWIDGTCYIDKAPLSELSANDTFLFDVEVYHVEFELFLNDDAGHTIATFRTL